MMLVFQGALRAKREGDANGLPERSLAIGEQKTAGRFAKNTCGGSPGISFAGVSRYVSSEARTGRMRNTTAKKSVIGPSTSADRFFENRRNKPFQPEYVHARREYRQSEAVTCAWLGVPA
jgi:hypothetical protein